jgi:hypothetical protein
MTLLLNLLGMTGIAFVALAAILLVGYLNARQLSNHEPHVNPAPGPDERTEP